MNRNSLVSAALAFTLLSGTSVQLHSQEFSQDTTLMAQMPSDTVMVVTPDQETGPSTEELLKAKVDSLRNALSETSAPRRRLSVQRLLMNADSLRLRYDFHTAEEMLVRAAENADTSQVRSIEDALAMTRNGLNMMSYCSSPSVIAKQKFALEDFFLMYPLEDGAWRRTPNTLDKGKDAICQATFIPDSSKTIYYSAPDDDGIRNIYMTHRTEGQWAVPQLINESVTSSSNEIFPMLSPDERTLYFASEGLYGMGGYDLYMSRWNRETNDWEQPVNMGFPYSSPYDDFLFINTDDGRYSIFASNRECSADSVYIYVLEYDAMPLRHAVDDVRELRRLSLLNPVRRPRGTSRAEEEKTAGTDVSAYMEKMEDVRALRDSIYQFNKELDGMRSQLAEIPAEEQSSHISAIMEKEQGLPLMQKRLDKAVKDLQDIELEFLARGVLLNASRIQEEPEPENRETEPTFEFTRHEYGESLSMDILEPEPDFDYSFKILPEGQFAESNVLPDGLVYQIQIASGANKLKVQDLHGLSPVFERMSTSLRYTYAVGIFRSYSDVLAHLNSVKKAGFRDAFITSFLDGKQVSVDVARSQETRFRRLYQVHITPEDGRLPDLAVTAIHQHTAKDIVRRDENGTTVYVVGPFDDRAQAESLITSLRATGVSSATIVED